MLKEKTPNESLSITTKVVLPNDTNTLGKLFGGSLLAWIDEIGAVAAHRHSGRVSVTASINNVSFTFPVDLGSIMTLEAKVSRAFNSSMEVIIDVYIEDSVTRDKTASNQAILTFVAIDENGKSVEVPKLIPETEEEKERYAAALRRRQLSLILAGRLKAEDAPELKAIFKL
ncbi:acyl-CoA thioesterase [Crocinitomix catalasitica]|uniref:acyl-CoA thioesterase n=1 Tax=Crocinitomix catalasitica TaxID=184607 RepID=UPI00048904A3|nr:acyl-CoA thioesterase [Crocinitomix catalasitica]